MGIAISMLTLPVSLDSFWDIKNMQLTTRLKTILIIAVIVILAIIGTLFFLSNKPTKPLPNEVKIAPITNTVFPAGSHQSMTVIFSLPVDTKAISFHLNKTSVTSNNAAQPVDANVTFEDNFHIARITPKDSIDPNSQYTLTVSDSKNGNIIASANYSSTDLLASPAPSNNPQLKSYLPYNTPTYSIDYFEPRNTYQFHFIYDPKSKVDIESQYQNAKENAIQFIKSKGIDINSIVIEWKRF